MKSKYVIVKKIYITEATLVFTSHHPIHIEVNFKIKLEEIEALKEKFKVAFSSVFISPLVKLTIVT